ncbi:complex I subunit 5 family protein [Arsukibacterium sp.]|uniref:complex I subunit 5 family protein n=1 Tax=Arsukibacterium sp. TaxID=1977258 RepID=UPI00299DE044|nr:proton-conducting transporter membrane subunit [Arsukibacterium sp.]MDX1678080.1 proton-conducting transporter membrane subunit [Arsukibacterium sp.]
MIVMLLMLPLLGSLLMIIRPAIAPLLTLVIAVASNVLALQLLQQISEEGTMQWLLAGWPAGLGIVWQAGTLTALLILLTTVLQLLVGLYAFVTHKRDKLAAVFWPLSNLLQFGLIALWLSRDLFNLYICLELLGLVAVALVSLAGGKAIKPAINYLLLSLLGSLCYLLGVVLLYGIHGILDIATLASQWQDNQLSYIALLLMSGGLMLKAALWPLHLWLPGAHSAAPAPVSALLSALVVKGPLYILCLIWIKLAAVQQASAMAPLFIATGMAALVFGGWSALRTPFAKTMVAYSTVAQLGYALLALGFLLKFSHPLFFAALWLFVLSHALAKAACFLAIGEISATLGGKRLTALKGASQTMPLAMFAFALSGVSLIGLPPSGGFLGKWTLVQGIWQHQGQLLWMLPLVLVTLLSAAYVMRVVVLTFDQAKPVAPDFAPKLLPQWLALVPALAVCGMAFLSEPLLLLLQADAL